MHQKSIVQWRKIRNNSHSSYRQSTVSEWHGFVKINYKQFDCLYLKYTIYIFEKTRNKTSIAKCFSYF